MKLAAVILLSLVSVAVVLSPASAVVYVKWDSPGPFDGNSWETAYHTIQQGLDDADVGNEEC